MGLATVAESTGAVTQHVVSAERYSLRYNDAWEPQAALMGGYWTRGWNLKEEQRE